MICKFLCQVVVGFMIVLTSLSGNADVKIIANSQNDWLLYNHLTIANIFTKKTTKWSNGRTITVFIKPLESIEHKDFVHSMLHMTHFKFSQDLNARITSGNGVNVIQVSSDEEMLMRISNTPFSIGYVNFNTPVNPGLTIIDSLD